MDGTTPTPRPQDSTAAPRESATAWYANPPGLFGPSLAADLAAFEEALPPAQADQFRHLVSRLDDEVADRASRAEEETWQRTLAHFPGLAPALEHIRADAEGMVGACCTLQEGGPDAE
jgi:hypothetical protein